MNVYFRALIARLRLTSALALVALRDAHRWTMRACVVGLTLAGATACALATFSGDYAGTCGFGGRTDAACGMCIAANCQASVNACCADPACGQRGKSTLVDSLVPSGKESALTKLDRCATGGTCEDLELDAQGGTIGECVATSCAGVCDTWRHSTLTAPRTNCTYAVDSGETQYCSCQVPGTTGDAPPLENDVACNTTSIADNVCCADKAWPAPGSKCSCWPAMCFLYSDSCACELAGSSTHRTTSCGRSPCCITTNGKCACGSTCKFEFSFIASVEVCTKELVFCGQGSRTVTSCSAVTK